MYLIKYKIHERTCFPCETIVDPKTRSKTQAQSVYSDSELVVVSLSIVSVINLKVDMVVQQLVPLFTARRSWVPFLDQVGPFCTEFSNKALFGYCHCQRC